MTTALRLAVEGSGPRADALEAAARALGWHLVTADLDRAEVDVVAVVDPTARSSGEIIRQLEAGRHVIADPPWCRTLAECDRVVEASRACGRAVLHAEYISHAPAFITLLDQLRGLGPPRHLDARFLAPDPTPSGATQPAVAEVVRRFAPAPVTLVLLAARRAGLGDPTGSSLTVAGDATGAGATSTSTSSRLVVEFGGAVRATITVGTHRGTANVCDIQVASETGVVRSEILPAPMVERDGEQIALRQPAADPPELELFGHLGQLEALATAIRRGAAPATDAAFGRRVLATVLDALDRS